MRIIHIGNSRRAGDEQEIWGITAAENAQHTAKKQDIYFFEQKKQSNLSKESKNMGIYYAAFVQLLEEEKPQELGKSTEKILQRAGNAYFRAEKVIATNLACVIIVLRNAICA